VTILQERPGGGWAVYARELLEEDLDAVGGLVALRAGEDVYFLHGDHG